MSEMGLVSRVAPVQMAMRNCTRNEGRSFEVSNQVLISSHRKLLSLMRSPIACAMQHGVLQWVISRRYRAATLTAGSPQSDGVIGRQRVDN